MKRAGFDAKVLNFVGSNYLQIPTSLDRMNK